MLEGEGTGEGTGTGAGTGIVEKPAWVAQLPTDLKDNEAFTAYKTLGDLAKTHLDYAGKVKEFEGMKAKYEGAIPKLPENATDEQRNEFYKALGRPDKADDYQFLDKDGKPMATNTSKWAKESFFKRGVPKEMAAGLAEDWNGFVQSMMATEVQTRERERGEAETKLKAELGDKYDASVELVRRVWQKFSDTAFDGFANETKIGNDPRMIRFILNVAKLTGEDKSPSGSLPKGEIKPGGDGVFQYPNTPK